jgi:hypothetical protein
MDFSQVKTPNVVLIVAVAQVIFAVFSFEQVDWKIAEVNVPHRLIRSAVNIAGTIFNALSANKESVADIKEHIAIVRTLRREGDTRKSGYQVSREYNVSHS